MIARLWAAKTSRANAPAYAAHLRDYVLAALRKVDGYAGAKLLEREADAEVEILVLTFWHSLESIKRFAGEDFEKAVVSDDIAPLLSRYDLRATHYEVAVEDQG